MTTPGTLNGSDVGSTSSFGSPLSDPTIGFSGSGNGAIGKTIVTPSVAIPAAAPGGSGSSSNTEAMEPLSVWSLSLPGTAIKSDDFNQTLNFIVRCKDGDLKKAEDFLRECMRSLKRNQNPDEETEESEDTSEANREFGSFVGDETDDKPTTLVLLVPGQPHIIGHLIGKSGSEITKLESAANVSIRVESKSKMPLGSSERRIYIVGSVANCIYTQQRITQRINEKLREEGVKQELIKVVIPHESVPHLIGKGGSCIKRLQELSRARIQVEQETSVVPGTIGRAVTIQGTQYERSMAQYLISRQMAENRSTRKEWQGGVPQPQSVGSNIFGPSNLILDDFIPGVPAIPGLPSVQQMSSDVNGIRMTPGSTSATGAANQAAISGRFYMPEDMQGPGGVAAAGAVAAGAGYASSGWLEKEKAWQEQQHRLYCEENEEFEQAQTYERLVPDGAVAHLIGRQGSVISEIQKKSGTRISFSKNPGPRAAEVGMGMGYFQKVSIGELSRLFWFS